MIQKNNLRLTKPQLRYLDSLSIGDIVKNIRLLKKFGSAGLLELHEQTGTQVYVGWAQCYTKCYYIYDCKEFQVDGFSFHEKYFDGCFMPFLVLTSKMKSED
jgi:coproporphyrinogen III oxidase-like Fe-S oxidoreductase